MNDRGSERDRRLCGKRIHSDHDPLNTTDTARGGVGELVECMGREVEIAVGTRLTPVRELDGDSLALVCN